MAFRDDRDALLARADALARENERLRDELEAARARADAEAARRGEVDALARDKARVEAELAEARARHGAELRRLRGPGRLARLRAWWATRRTAPAPAEAGFARAALAVWRVWVPFLPMFVIALAVVRDAWALLLLAIAAVGAPVGAALAAAFAWGVLRRRRRADAGAAAAVGAWLVLVAAGAGAMFLGWRAVVLDKAPLALLIWLAAVTTPLGLRAARAADAEDLPDGGMPWILWIVFLGPHYFVLAITGALWMAEVGSRLADGRRRDAGADR